VGLPETIERTRGAIVQVMYTIDGLSQEALEELRARGPVFSQPFGTAFLVSTQGYAVTAHHVLTEIEQIEINYRDEGTHYRGLGFPYPNEERQGLVLRSNYRSIPFEVVGTDERNDLALLRLLANPFAMSASGRRSSKGQVFEPQVAILDPRRPTDGAAVAVSGFPLDQPWLITTSGHVASAWAADVGDEPNLDDADYQPDIADRYVIDAQTNTGNSGGPVYLIDSGAVIGVLINNLLANLVGEYTQLGVNANLGELVPVPYVVELMERHGVKASLAS
jgi:S1-C subfamily serine protease